MGLCSGLAWHDKEEIEGLINAMTGILGFGVEPSRYYGLVYRIGNSCGGVRQEIEGLRAKMKRERIT